jgi:starvation-inducible DNA-binding protein
MDKATKNSPAKIRTFVSRIDIPTTARLPLIELLNKQLANTLDLYTQTKQAHWNVKGSQFIMLHELFDKVAGVVFESIDEIAERATALGGVALGTVRMAAQHSMLEEYPTAAVTGEEHLNALVDRLASYAASVCSAIEQAQDLGDLDTADLFTSISRDMDKYLWFLEAHLQNHEGSK